MEVLAHRGCWKEISEQNTLAAFETAFVNGFGIETDLRDCLGEIVVSHDMPQGGESRFSDLIDLYNDKGQGLTLALNIKSDGLATSVQQSLSDPGRSFYFDMSVPDQRHFVSNSLPFYTRMSELELSPSLLDEAVGVWLDCFSGFWVEEAQIQELVEKNKVVCFVSPELHRREIAPEWNRIKSIVKNFSSGCFQICTDDPFLAQEFFNERD